MGERLTESIRFLGQVCFARKLTDTQREVLGSLYDDGATLFELGAQFGVSGVAIANELEQQGHERRSVGMRKGDYRRQDISDNDIIQKYRDGATMTDLAEEKGVSTKTIFDRLKNNGVPTRPRGRPKKRTQ